MQAKYMEKYLGEEFDGIISGVTDWGVFVELPHMGCEGLVRLREFTDDYYYVEAESFQIVGERTGQTHRLGDPLRIVVKEVDVLKKTIDFGVAGSRSAGAFGRSSSSTRGRFSDTRPSESGERWSSGGSRGGSSRGGSSRGDSRGDSRGGSKSSSGRGPKSFKAKGPKTTPKKKRR